MEWLDRGSYNYEAMHPPLARVSVALGLYLSGVRSSGLADVWTEGNAILESRAQYKKNLVLARLGVLPYFWIACILLWSFVVGTMGEWSAAVAVFLFSFCPPVLAHSSVATTDLPLMTMFLWSIMRFWYLLKSPNTHQALSAGAVMGFAILSKFSALPFLLVTCGGLYIYKYWKLKRPPIRWKAAFFGILLISVIVWGGYRFSFGPIVPKESVTNSHKRQKEELNKLPPSIATIIYYRKVPAHEFFRGLGWMYVEAKEGREAYLLGQNYTGGRWYFFPVALLVKTPIPLLILSATGIFYAVIQLLLEDNESLLVPLLGLLCPLAIAMMGKVNLGLRHVLAIYPFLVILAALAVLKLWQSHRSIAVTAAIRSTVVVLLCWNALSTIRAAPDFLAYFNEPSARYESQFLVGSDVDWGQDIFRLSAALRELNVSNIWLAYFGTTDLTKRDLPNWQALPPLTKPDGWVAISIYYLKTKPQSYGWLEKYKPVRRVGHSILLYHF